MIGNVRSARKTNAFVVRERLTAVVPIEIFPPDRIAEAGPKNLPGAVAATVADDDDLEIAVGLTQPDRTVGTIQRAELNAAITTEKKGFVIRPKVCAKQPGRSAAPQIDQRNPTAA